MRNFLALLLIATVALVGCSGDRGTSSKQPVEPDIDIQQILEQAWLRDVLPTGALAYARLPNPWFSFSSQENGFKYAQGNEAHIQQLKNIQRGLYANVLDTLEPGAKMAAYLLTRHMKAPLELAVVPSPDTQPGPPKLVIASVFDFETVDAFKAAFEPLLQLAPNGVLTQPADSSGKGTLAIQGLTAYYHFDAVNRRFEMVVGIGPANGLDQVVPAMVANAQHPMYGIEEQTDTSKSGLFVWLSPKAILPLAGPMIPPQQSAQISAMGLNQVDSISLGYGVANGKSRLQLLVEMPDVGARQLLPIVNNSFAFDSVGEPSLLVSLSIPVPEQLARFEAGLISITGKLPDDYIEFKQQVVKEAGFSLEEILSLLGPELVYFEDELGEFLAVRVGDRNNIEKILKGSEQSDQFDYSVHKSGSTEIHHISMPIIFPVDLASIPASGSDATLRSLITGIGSHYFWLDEGDFLILSEIPQTLIERASNKNRTSVAKWLAENQRQDLSGAILGLSGTVDKLSREGYADYVLGLQILADLVDAEFDIFALPVASELGFAERGSLSMNIDMQDKYIAVEFGFEEGLADLFYAGGSYQTVAVVGVLAAIALPAYQDYVKRAKAAEERALEY